ncbi:hypothetical protein [Breznakiella homolactica]|uniref:3-hexulose-6-phosphate synthase n=1 Tax=Breznakiella homolactica TaxID=2798577 RepID=A0A7T7XLC4_9SPIR|nr:hypothetical protein [Breznakiella homolactica]QQO08534.1 hypothetical protein JFL75_16590 [Breznakiella homolactica]
MKLQLAFDNSSAEDFFRVMDQVKDVIDVFELGWLGNHLGAIFIKEAKAKYPNIPLVWDQKSATMFDCMPPVEYGADYVSIAFCSEPVAKAAVDLAHPKGVKVVGDIVHSACDGQAILKFARVGCDEISLFPFMGYDNPDVTPLKVANVMREQNGLPISVYGKLTVDNMKPVLELKPDIVVIGAAIVQAADPRTEAMKIKDLMAKY